MNLYSLIRPLLFLLDAERAHHLTLTSLKHYHDYLAPWLDIFRETLPHQHIACLGMDFPNAVGLAAGLDKNGDYIDALANLGFGFIEIGTVTPKPQNGNPLPRLFRIPEQKSILNRMGFNNFGIDYLLNAVMRSQWVKNGGILGINIGKNATTSMENAYLDYVYCLEKAYPLASYIVANISSPNTQNLRDLQHDQALKQLLHALKTAQQQLHRKHQKYVPLLIKIAPDLTGQDIMQTAQTLLDHDMDGVIATNTTLDKSQLPEHFQSQAGGVSGFLVQKQANSVLEALVAYLDGKIPVIGVGGIMNGADAFAKRRAGASLVQIYSGLIYEGPNLVKDCIKASHPQFLHLADHKNDH